MSEPRAAATARAGGAQPSPDDVAVVEAALEDLRQGRFVLVADDASPDSYADLLVAAERADAAAINFLATEARGILYLALTEERCEQLGLPPAEKPPENPSWVLEGHEWKRAMRVMIDAREGISTGISAADRARTVALALDPASGPEAFVIPGHIVPLAAHPGGIMQLAGRNEAFVDLPRLAGLAPAGVASAMMTDDGAVGRVADVADWCREHGVRIVSVAGVRAVAARRLPWLQRRPASELRTAQGSFELINFRDPIAGEWHRAIVGGGTGVTALASAPGGDGEQRPATRVAVLGSCSQGEALGRIGCARRGAAERALAALAEDPVGGVVLHLHDGSPCCHPDTAGPAVAHAWEVAARILAELGVERVAPLDRHGEDHAPLARYGFELVAAQEL